jgi:hypothetical protein
MVLDPCPVTQRRNNRLPLLTVLDASPEEATSEKPAAGRSSEALARSAKGHLSSAGY